VRRETSVPIAMIRRRLTGLNPEKMLERRKVITPHVTMKGRFP